MATTKCDLLRDILTDALIDLEFNFDPSDDGDGNEVAIEMVRDEVIEDMLSAVTDLDQVATGSDFSVRVVMDKEVKNG